MTTEQLYATRDALQKLAQWHETQRDGVPWLQVERNLAVFHNKAASECYNAAIALGELIEKRAEF